MKIIKNITVISLTLSVLLTACGQDTEIKDSSAAVSTASTTAASFQEKISKIMADTTKDPVYIESTDDYDRNGQPEAFVVTVLAQDAKGDGGFCTGNLYFVASDLTVTRLENNVPVEYDKAGPDPSYYQILRYSDRDLFVFNECGGTDIRSMVYSVSGNKAVSALDKNMCIELQKTDNEHEILANVTDFDANVDEDGIGSGRTEKTYWFYYKNGKIYEYNGKEISVSDLKKIGGAAAIIDGSCKNGWKIQNVLYRPNGIININYRHTCKSGAYDNKYDTLRATFDAQHHISGVKTDSSEDQTDNSGEYKEAQ